jgi:pimeloyl-ACP methyl ester carboxylesterase
MTGQQDIDAYCVVSGTLAAADELQGPFIVSLARASSGTPAWQGIDHFVLEGAGRWGFVAPAGAYRIAAFEDVNRNFRYEAGEPFVAPESSAAVTCAAGGRFTTLALRMPQRSQGRLDATLGLSSLTPRDSVSQVNATLGQLTEAGRITTLADPRFSDDTARSGLWRPFDFLMDGYAGIYFLAPHDPGKIPVLFVHGINGSPASFSYLVDQLDRSRFEPWIYYYPSGAHLGALAAHLDQTVARLQLRHGVNRIAVVAHSMGGLVARGFVLRRVRDGRSDEIPVFVTISTPWGGHAAAELAVKTAPAVVRVWEDMAPGSEYLRSLYATVSPREPPHHLLFTFERKSTSFGPSDDQGVTVASQLAPGAQRNATRLYGFDDSHMSVLRDPEAAALVNRLLIREADPPR